MKFCQHCGSEIDGNSKFCFKCGASCDATDVKKPVKSKWFFIFSGIFALISLVSGGVYVYQDVNMPPAFYARGVLESYAAIGSRNAIEDLNALDSFMTIHSALFYSFWAFLVVAVALLTTAILIKVKQKKK